MRTLKFIFTAILAVLVGTIAFAQMHDHSKMSATKIESTVTKTVTIKVSGNCETCKARIEKAAKVAGVTKAD